jgi:predicted lipoprotein
MEAIFKNSFLMALLMMAGSSTVNADSFQTSKKLMLLASAEKALSEELDKARGREGVDVATLNLQNVQATLNNNQASNNVSGYNVIADGSFAGASGITSVVQNSGNNVIIQDTTIVNVTVAP